MVVWIENKHLILGHARKGVVWRDDRTEKLGVIARVVRYHRLLFSIRHLKLGDLLILGLLSFLICNDRISTCKERMMLDYMAAEEVCGCCLP